MYDVVENLAYEMRLFGVKANLVRRCDEAMADGHHPAQVLQLLLEDERNARKQAAAKRLTARAKFRSQCTLEDWDQSFDRGMSKAQFKSLAHLDFQANHENLILVGKTGVGKTHLGIALGNRICGEAESVRFYSVNLLFEEIIAERTSGKYLQFIRKLTKTKTLILDDFGLRKYSHSEATALLEIIEERYKKGILIVTSQVSPKGWVSLFDDPVVAEAIIDRLLNPSKIIEMKGDSFRKRGKRN